MATRISSQTGRGGRSWKRQRVPLLGPVLATCSTFGRRSDGPSGARGGISLNSPSSSAGFITIPRTTSSYYPSKLDLACDLQEGGVLQG